MDELELSDIYLSQNNIVGAKDNYGVKDTNVKTGTYGLELLMNTAKAKPLNEPKNNDDTLDDFEKDLTDLTSKTTEQYNEPHNEPYQGWGNMFASIPETPIVQEKPVENTTMLQKKKQLLIKLSKMRKMGIEISQNYTMENTYEEIHSEFTAHYDERKKEEGVKLQRNTLLTIMPSLEYYVNQYNPFGIDLDGLTEATRENINEYDDIFEELYDKYKPDMAVMPELRLAFAIGRSAAEISYTNALIKKDAPNLSEVLKVNPGLAKQLHIASLNTMSSKSQEGSQTAEYLSKFFPSFESDNKSYHQTLNEPIPRVEPNINVERPEMSGPSNISHIVSSITPKIQQQHISPQHPSLANQRDYINQVMSDPEYVKQQMQRNIRNTEQPVKETPISIGPVKKVRRKKSEKVAQSLGLTSIETSSF
jgi:hypothetical protein